MANQDRSSKGRGRGRGVPQLREERSPGASGNTRFLHNGYGKKLNGGNGSPNGSTSSEERQHESSRRQNGRMHNRGSPRVMNVDFSRDQDQGKSSQKERNEFARVNEYGNNRGSSYGPLDCFMETACPSLPGFEKITIKSLPTAQDLGTTPLRPNFGTKGRVVELISNHYPLEVPRGHVYEYDFSIKLIGEKSVKTNEGKDGGLGKNVCKVVFQEFDKHHRSTILEDNFPAFDGLKNVVLPRRLKHNVYTVKLSKVPLKNGECSFQVTLKFTQQIDLEPLHHLFECGRKLQTQANDSTRLAVMKWKEAKKDEVSLAITALNIVLRHGPSFTLTPVGRSFFLTPGPGECHPLSGGREVWYGYHQSLRPGWKPFVVIDKVATTFYKPHQNVADFAADVLAKRSSDIRKLSIVGPVFDKLNKELKNVKVIVTHLPYKRTFTVKGITRKSARETTFDLEQNGKRRISVEEYFRMTYGKVLTYPNLPCLEVGQGRYLPMEICELVPNQHCNKMLTERQTAEMIKLTASRPSERFATINKMMGIAKKESREVLREFGISISDQPAKVPSRVLSPPQILYQCEKTVNPRDGAWDMREKKFQRGASINNWALLSFEDPQRCGNSHLMNLIDCLRDIGKRAGLHLGNNVEMLVCNYSAFGDAKKVLQQMKDWKMMLVVIVIPNNKALYAEIKTVADTMLGLVTQCVRSENVVNKVSKMRPQLVSNLCLKINAKLGGINASPISQTLPNIQSMPVIYMGADVTHPSPGDNINPSVAAVVGSLDGYPSQHAVEIRVQKEDSEIKSRVEIILDLQSMVKKLLRAFYRNTQKKPEKIIFYRDGVSEGQFRQVRNYEIKAIREACHSLQPDYEPPITFIVVQKRHHTRFYPGDPRDGSRNGNITPGSVVDRGITHPLDFDFFLCSHYGLQGTSRPTHYYVLWDDNNYDSDTLYEMTYSLCHAYVRCTRSISIPAQVMYAHLAAFRARHYLQSGNLKNIDICEVVQAAQETAQKMYFV